MSDSTQAVSTHDTPEGLRRCQVETPGHLVNRVWDMVHDVRGRIDRVLDLGAGDGRFAGGGTYAEYVGVEIDPSRHARQSLPANATVLHQCASTAPDGFDVVIGNPPYTRHQDIDPEWRERVRASVHDAVGYEISRFANLYLYFMWLSMLKTRAAGLVALIVPFEWVSRPSAASLRDYLRANNYRADVYRLPDSALFSNVKTTASITIIDKAAGRFDIRWHRMTKGLEDVERDGSKLNILPYEDALGAQAFRGFSSGSQDVFMLSEPERTSAGIRLNQVVPCIASLRSVPDHLTTLNPAAFEAHYIQSGRKCWLLKTEGTRGAAVRNHLASAPDSVKKNWTCSKREPWYSYSLPHIPDLVYSSGFRGSRPRVLINACNVRVAGGVHGIITPTGLTRRTVHDHIQQVDFSRITIPHARGLRKVEVRQMNAVLNQLAPAAGGS